MKKHLIFLVALLALQASAQDTVFVRYNKEWSEEVKYVTDTLIFPGPLARQMLFGTTLIPSGRRYGLYEYGLTPQKVEFKECEGPGEHSGPDHIDTILLKDNKLIVSLTLYDNCCYSFLCDTEADEDGIINLTYIGYGSFCACNCCFGLTYIFDYEPGPETVPPKAVMINGDRKTLKKITRP